MGYNIVPTYNFLSKYKFGLAYFDEKGRTHGVVTNASFDVSTPPYALLPNGDINVPRITFSINHKPPVWAKSYQWVRTKNLTLSKFLYWVSESTYKDNEFAYIGIQNLYAQKDENTQTILSYDFTPGDRVRLIKTDTGDILTDKDYEIKELVNNPEISGTARSGYFLKIHLPVTDATTFDFGTSAFRYYLINIYSNAPLVENNLNTFYEFGEAYEIGDAGLDSRYHRGAIQNQSPDQTIPAKFIFTKGDVYVKDRRVDLGETVTYTLSGDAIWTEFTIGATFNDSDVGNTTYTNGNSTVSSVTSSMLDNDDTTWIAKTAADPYSFKIAGTVTINIDTARRFRLLAIVVPQPAAPLPQTRDLIPAQFMSVGDHKFSFNTSITVPPNSRLYIMGVQEGTSGTTHITDGELKLTNTAFTSHNIVDVNFSDTFLSSVNSNGRPLVVEETGETYNPTMYRWSEAYQAGTNINNTNRFYPLNYDECDRARGDIMRFKVRANLMHVFQYRGCGSIPIFQQILNNADGSTNLMQSDKIVNKIRYYQGEYGIGNQPASLASSAGADYFCDPVRGYQCRLAGDGITPISELYKAQYFMPPLLKKYLNGFYVNDAGSFSRLLGCYDFVNEDYLTVFQTLNDDGVTDLHVGDTLAFNEPRNAYTSFHDFAPESIVCAGTTILSWREGMLYAHDSPVMNTFYGNFHPSVIERVVNISANVKKEFASLGYHADTAWESSIIATDIDQLSNLIPSDYEFREGMFTAAFMRDQNSLGGLIDGDFLKGLWMQLRLENFETTPQVLFGLYVNYLISTKNF